MRHKKNAELDAHMVIAVRQGLFEPWAMAQGILPNEAFSRKEWLPKQSKQYLNSVEVEVRKIEQQRLMDGIKGS